MKLLLGFALALVQAAPQATAPEPAPAPVKPWHGSLAEGLREMQRLSEAEKPDEALAIADGILAPDRFARWREGAVAQGGWKRALVLRADPLLAAVGLSELAPAERAAVHFARGVTLARAEKRAEAGEAFEKARAEAGAGGLRLDSTYDLGWTALADGEAFRAQIPELKGAGAPPAAAAPNAAVPGPLPEKADPLELARAAYLKARGHFVERLKAEGSDEDTRANAELVQKRLRELAEIQKKREEEKKKQEQEKKDQDKKDQQKKDQDKKDSDKQDPDKKDPSSQDKDKKQDEQQKKPEDEKKDSKKDEESEKEKKEKKDAQAQSSKEELLTKEEIMRLLDTLKNREEEGKKLLEQLRHAKRARVKKDW